MEVIVLGTSGAYARPGDACSGYLVRGKRTRILVDLGTGVFSNLLRWQNPFDLDLLIFTHLHPDHFLDIYPMRYFLQFTKFTKEKKNLPLEILAPQGAEEYLLRLVSSRGRPDFKRMFHFKDIIEGKDFFLDDSLLRFCSVAHPELTYAVAIIEDKKKIVYSSDTSYTVELVEFVEGAHLFICEATLQGKDEGQMIGHLTAADAAKIAQEAGVEKLLLTHFWGEYDPKMSLEEAKAIFPRGEIVVAAVNATYGI